MSAVLKTAELSPDRRYRYRLTRSWGDGPHVVFVMLNPSTADASEDDATIRRCMGYARDWGFCGIDVVNLYALRSKNPDDLWAASDPVGPSNDYWLQMIIGQSPAVIAAWGAGARPERVAELRRMVPANKLFALGVTKDGAPRHPLYLPKDAKPVAWPSR
nr:DUF1643 domain-containing protein [Actinomyces sp.]